MSHLIVWGGVSTCGNIACIYVYVCMYMCVCVCVCVWLCVYACVRGDHGSGWVAPKKILPIGWAGSIFCAQGSLFWAKMSELFGPKNRLKSHFLLVQCLPKAKKNKIGQGPLVDQKVLPKTRTKIKSSQNDQL